MSDDADATTTIALLKSEALRAQKFRHDTRPVLGQIATFMETSKRDADLASAIVALTAEVKRSASAAQTAITDALKTTAEASRDAAAASERAERKADAAGERVVAVEGVQRPMLEVLTRTRERDKVRDEAVAELKRAQAEEAKARIAEDEKTRAMITDREKKREGRTWETWKIVLAVLAILVPTVIAIVSLAKSW